MCDVMCDGDISLNMDILGRSLRSMCGCLLDKPHISLLAHVAAVIQTVTPTKLVCTYRDSSLESSIYIAK
jgi:hypothetical protein